MRNRRDHRLGSDETPRTLFPLGRIVATPSALDVIKAAAEVPLTFLLRHVRGDWGSVDSDDWQANNSALRAGSRLLSAYRTKLGSRLWVITEADRSSTCILLPDEY